MMKKLYRSPPTLRGYNYSLGQIKKARAQGRILTMRLETSAICNYCCIYCNGLTGKKIPSEISFNVMDRVVSEAKTLGCKSVVIIGGGEPTIYFKFRNLIRHINKSSMIPVVITNASQLSLEMCKFLYDENASVLFKLDSLDEKIQDRLTNKKGAYRLIMQGIDNLSSVGFNTNRKMNLRWGASFVVNKLNYKGIVKIWKFCRENNIYPNFEEFIPRNRGLCNFNKLWLDKREVHRLKKSILNLDQKEYGYDWLVHAPLLGHGCLQFMYSVYVTSQGYVRPCADIDVKLFNIKRTTIKKIIKSSFYKFVRNIEKNLEGKCSGCEHNNVCIGCRGNAFCVGREEGLDIFQALCREDPLCHKK